MLKFIHTYTEDSFRGIFEKGLWREGDGFKLMHKNYLPEERLFNEIAKVGGVLYERIKELNCPFYIDRFQGGIPFPYEYDYDKNLLDEYKKMLGDKFLGFQMHEWVSNFESENKRVLEAKKNWIAEHGSLDGFWEHYIDVVKTDPMALFTEAWSVEEWSKMKHPENINEFVDYVYKMWKLRAEQTGCPMFPADSGYLAPKIEIEMGAELLLPEIGWQIEGTRLQIAYNRGMAKAANIPWGVYYECWGANQDGRNGSVDDRLTVPYSLNSFDNEWTEDELQGQIVERTHGNPENGGSSRSLQERMWVYSYFSGAQYMGEEYGVCNTFKNLQDFELSEYGKVKKKFLDFTVKYPDLGETYTPVAIVLPAELPIYTFEAIDKYLGYTLEQKDSDLAEKIRNIKKTLNKLFYKKAPDYDWVGRDAHCMQNTDYPDVFNIIHGDAEEAVKEYEYIIDLTGDADFAKSHGNIIDVDDLDGILKKMLPCRFSETLHSVYNRTENGWLVFAANNNGILRDADKGEYSEENSTVVSDIIFNDSDMSITKLEGSGELLFDGKEYNVSLGAGQWIILEITEV